MKPMVPARAVLSMAGPHHPAAPAVLAMTARLLRPGRLWLRWLKQPLTKKGENHDSYVLPCKVVSPCFRRPAGRLPRDTHWFDATKESFCDFRHRALRHHAEGIFECERVFGTTITNSDGKEVPVRYIGEQHVMEDCGGRVPSLSDWLSKIQPEPWMARGSLVGHHTRRAES